MNPFIEFSKPNDQQLGWICADYSNQIKVKAQEFITNLRAIVIKIRKINFKTKLKVQSLCQINRVLSKWTKHKSV